MLRTVLVIEDDPIDLISIKAKIRELGYPDPLVSDHKTDMKLLVQSTNPQLVISDIYYDKTPLGLLLIDICKTHAIPLILMTADTRFHTYDLAHKHKEDKVAYLVKPFHHFTLQTCIDMVMENGNTTAAVDDKFMFVKDYGNHKVKLRFKDILFVRAEGNFCHIQCQKEHFMIRTSLALLSGELSEDFMQVHKSFLINKTQVDKISHSHIIIKTQEIPIGRKFRRSIQEILLH